MKYLIIACLVFVVTNDAVHAFPNPDTVFVFTNVNVVPMDSERILKDHTVVVRDGRIISVGPSAEITYPDDAKTIDSEGKYLMPGLAEMHGHIPPPTASLEFIDNVLFMYVANGITTVRGMLGYPGQLDLREKAKAGAIISPNLYLAGPSFNGNSVSSPEQAIDKVRQQVAEGWDLLKVHPGLTKAEYDAMARTANELGIRFGGHVPADVGLEHAIEMGQETFDHLDGYIAHLNGDQGPVDSRELNAIVQKTTEAGALVVPTMALWEVLWGTANLEALRFYDELKYMPTATVNQWIQTHENRLNNVNYDYAVSYQVIENRMKVLSALHRAGAGILMGTDAPQQFSVPGFSLHRELQIMVRAGMTPFEIIKTGTTNVGSYFRKSDTFGMVAVGHRADLILVDGNPLDAIGNIKNPDGVMVNGRWIARSEITSKLNEIAESYRGDTR